MLWEIAEVAGENGHALAVSAPNLEEMVKVTSNLKEGGFDDLVPVVYDELRRLATEACPLVRRRERNAARSGTYAPDCRSYSCASPKKVLTK